MIKQVAVRRSAQGFAMTLLGAAALAPALAAQPAAQAAAAPVSILPPAAATRAPAPKPRVPTPNPAPNIVRDPADATAPTATLVAPPTVTTVVPVVEPVMNWGVGDARALLAAINGIEGEGLIPADYQPEKLAAAIAAGPGLMLDDVASHSFAWLAEDLRDGRTPMASRVQWFAVDPDDDLNPTDRIMAQALATHDIAGTLASLDPDHGEYAALRDQLAMTPPGPLRDAIRINMDRWRWLPRDLGMIYLLVNVPEFQVRLVSNHKIIRTYRTIVGKPGKTATPQLAEKVQAVVFNPTWTVPQSIVVGEGLGAKLIGNPASAAAQGYKATKNADGTITVVQQPGPKNSLGMMKIDMPNPHAIYLHDTPSRSLFDAKVRAFSHGCIRTEKAVELGMIMGMLGANLAPADAVAKSTSGKYTRVTMTKTFPVYINYTTYGRDTTGALVQFDDIYGRDAPVLASFAKPRELKTTQRTSNEAIIKLDNPL
ncbi:MAG: L,D-transpeptidase family protein [Sphingomonadales bacterium]|nr:L,D-transpeptidase family protein [Sphingomonadales bacterium]